MVTLTYYTKQVCIYSCTIKLLPLSQIYGTASTYVEDVITRPQMMQVTNYTVDCCPSWLPFKVFALSHY